MKTRKVVHVTDRFNQAYPLSSDHYKEMKVFIAKSDDGTMLEATHVNAIIYTTDNREINLIGIADFTEELGGE